jgi:hypothetical protein
MTDIEETVERLSVELGKLGYTKVGIVPERKPGAGAIIWCEPSLHNALGEFLSAALVDKLFTYRFHTVYPPREVFAGCKLREKVSLAEQSDDVAVVPDPDPRRLPDPVGGQSRILDGRGQRRRARA